MIVVAKRERERMVSCLMTNKQKSLVFEEGVLPIRCQFVLLFGTSNCAPGASILVPNRRKTKTKRGHWKLQGSGQKTKEFLSDEGNIVQLLGGQWRDRSRAAAKRQKIVSQSFKSRHLSIIIKGLPSDPCRICIADFNKENCNKNI